MTRTCGAGPRISQQLAQLADRLSVIDEPDRGHADGQRALDAGVDVVEKHATPGLDAEPTTGDPVKATVRLQEPLLVRIDDRVTHPLEAVKLALPLARAESTAQRPPSGKKTAAVGVVTPNALNGAVQ